MFKIVKGIPKPENLPTKRSSGSRYPFAEMKPGDSFVVPYAEMNEGEDKEEFRKRVYKSAREYARRNKTNELKMEFTAAVMDHDDTSEAKQYVTGDVVVWRDK